MTNASLVNRIPHEVDVIDEETTKVTFILPSNSVKGFVMMFMCFADLFRSVDWKQKTHLKNIHARLERQQPEIEAMVERYETAVISTYKAYLEEGNTARESLSLAVTKLSQTFPQSSYDMVKKCLTKNKLLKKTGFYGSRYKYAEK